MLPEQWKIRQCQQYPGIVLNAKRFLTMQETEEFLQDLDILQNIKCYLGNIEKNMLSDNRHTQAYNPVPTPAIKYTKESMELINFRTYRHWNLRLIYFVVEDYITFRPIFIEIAMENLFFLFLIVSEDKRIQNEILYTCILLKINWKNIVKNKFFC